MNETLNEILAQFQPTQIIDFATCDKDNKPKVRPVTLKYIDSRFWVLTFSRSAKAEQLRNNPNFEFCIVFGKDENSNYLRANGKVEIVENPETRKMIAEKTEFFSMFWKTHDDPGYMLLELKIEEYVYTKAGSMEEVIVKV